MKIKLFVMMIMLFSSVSVAQAKPEVVLYTVDRNDDVGGLPCTGASNDCTLRSAMQLADNNGATADTIFFSGDRSIVLTSPLPTIDENNLTITAFGSQDVEIKAPTAINMENIFIISAENISIFGLDLYHVDGGVVPIQPLIKMIGGAQDVTIADNLFGTTDDAWSGCGSFIGGRDGIVIESGASTIFIYDNEFYCLEDDGVVIEIGASDVRIGENASGDAGITERNSFSENGRGVAVEGLNNYVHNNDFFNNDGAGISVPGDFNDIYDNWTMNNSDGIDVSGGWNLIYANLSFDNTFDGINVTGNSNTIGCTSSGPYGAERRNVLTGNGRYGINIRGDSNLVACNYVGVGTNGSSADGNDIGIWVEGNSNIIGNIAPLSIAEMGNVISSNDESGILVLGTNHTIAGNTIGTDAGQTLDRGNGGSGIYVAGNASVTIGENTANSRNVIGFNGEHGIVVDGELTGDDGSIDIQRNYIGLLPNNSPAANAQAGIALLITDNINIGTATGCTDVEFCLEIAHNGTDGILLDNALNTTVGSFTYIYENGRHGIHLAEAYDSQIYAWITGNVNAGVAIATEPTPPHSTDNLIQLRRVQNNGGLPIDLGIDGVTTNDAGDGDAGPNTLLNYPVVTNSAGSFVSGTACADCFVDIYDLFGTAQQNGSGGDYVGTVNVDSGGNWSVDLSVYSLTPSNAVFTTRDADGNTSEMGLSGGVPTAVQISSVRATTPPKMLFLTLLGLLGMLTGQFVWRNP